MKNKHLIIKIQGFSTPSKFKFKFTINREVVSNEMHVMVPIQSELL